jgi:N-acetyl-anhydromuramyl-L-alanine amidase AmpD
MKLVAKLVSDITKRYQIPIKHVVGGQVLKGTGICGHHDITIAKKVAGGHTDPGANYPFTALIEKAKAI